MIVLSWTIRTMLDLSGFKINYTLDYQYWEWSVFILLLKDVSYTK